MPLLESKNVSRRQKLLRQVQSLLLETQHNGWEGSQENSAFSQLRSRAGIHTQRGRVWTSSLTRRSTGGQKLGKTRTREEREEREERGRPERGGAQSGGDVNHLHRTVLPGLCLPLATYLVSLFTPGPRMRPKMHAQLFAKVKAPRRGLWVHIHTYYGVESPPFFIAKKPSCACADKEVSLDLRSGHLLSLL